MPENIEKKKRAKGLRRRISVQVLLTPEQDAMVQRRAEANSISRPRAIRDAIPTQGFFSALEDEGNLILGRLDESGQIVASIPVPLLPF